MAKEKGPKAIEMTEEEFCALEERIKTKQLLEEDYILFGRMCQFVIWLQIKLQQSKISLNNLKRLLFGKSSEKSPKKSPKTLSLIATCELSKKNPIHYLKTLQENKEAVAKAAHLWLPWNYEDNFKSQVEASLEEAA